MATITITAKLQLTITVVVSSEITSRAFSKIWFNMLLASMFNLGLTADTSELLFSSSSSHEISYALVVKPS